MSTLRDRLEVLVEKWENVARCWAGMDKARETSYTICAEDLRSILASDEGVEAGEEPVAWMVDIQGDHPHCTIEKEDAIRDAEHATEHTGKVACIVPLYARLRAPTPAEDVVERVARWLWENFDPDGDWDWEDCTTMTQQPSRDNARRLLTECGLSHEGAQGWDNLHIEDRVAAAVVHAARAHAGQFYSETEPYILHPLRVMDRVEDEAAQVVAVLHDVLEDTDIGVPDWLNDTERRALDALTRRDGEEYATYVCRIRDQPGPSGDVARAVKTADLYENLSRLPMEHSLRNRYVRALEILRTPPSEGGEG